MQKKNRPLCLIILDGWGHREEKKSNAIACASKPNWDAIWQNNPHILIEGSGHFVGLPEEQMGNSEVGHLNMGAGRIVYQDLTRIDLAISTGKFFANPTLVKTIQETVASQKAIHVLGLLSPGGVHSHEAHFHALLKLAKEQGATRVYIHAFLDGRDTPPRSAMSSLQELIKHCHQLHCGEIASIIGRYYAMDRDKRWERIETAYDLLTAGKGFHAENPLHALENAYQRGENDEFVKPTAIHSGAPITIQDGDAIIFMNFRADRARELTQAFIDPQFQGFQRKVIPKLQSFVTLTEYDNKFPTSIVFPSTRLNNILAEYLSNLGLKQCRIAETEKYAHVTFFFNGGIETPYPGEDRILVPSPKVATYDLQPEMSAPELTEKLIKAITSGIYDVIICNYANPDMVGHTGNIPATIKAIETVDQCLGKVITALKTVGGEALITADHGNAELMFDEMTGQPHTAHTSELVPLVYVGRPAKVIRTEGILADIAPSMLYLMDLPQPIEMNRYHLFELI